MARIRSQLLGDFEVDQRFCSEPVLQGIARLKSALLSAIIGGFGNPFFAIDAQHVVPT
jgi:hypothetical protein